MSDDTITKSVVCADCGSDQIVATSIERVETKVAIHRVDHPPGEPWSGTFATTDLEVEGHRSGGVSRIRCDQCGSRDYEYVEDGHE